MYRGVRERYYDAIRKVSRSTDRSITRWRLLIIGPCVELLRYFGTADNNVHPNNMMQMIQALQKAGKSFELQAGPDLGHSGINNQRMMEFFIENLVLRKSVIAS